VCIAECSPADRAIFVTNHLLATAAPSGVIELWRVHLSANFYLHEGSKFSLETTLRTHELKVNEITASEAWSLLVSCSDDGTAVVWDMNRTRYLHTLRVEPREPVLFAAINEANVSSVGSARCVP
jgi:WD40 repeat protein